jgi:hypothetical protein
MADNESKLDFGYIVEGTVEKDPTTERFVIRTVDPQGAPLVFDPQRALGTYLGAEVRMILTSFETISRLQEMAEQGQLETPVDPKGGA